MHSLSPVSPAGYLRRSMAVRRAGRAGCASAERLQVWETQDRGRTPRGAGRPEGGAVPWPGRPRCAGVAGSGAGPHQDRCRSGGGRQCHTVYQNWLKGPRGRKGGGCQPRSRPLLQRRPERGTIQRRSGMALDGVISPKMHETREANHQPSVVYCPRVCRPSLQGLLGRGFQPSAGLPGGGIDIPRIVLGLSTEGNRG